MFGSLVLNIILILFGLFTLYGMIFLPNFYWNRGRIQRTRKILGDKGTRILYLLLGSVMVGVGVWGLIAA